MFRFKRNSETRRCPSRVSLAQRFVWEVPARRLHRQPSQHKTGDLDPVSKSKAQAGDQDARITMSMSASFARGTRNSKVLILRYNCDIGKRKIAIYQPRGSGPQGKLSCDAMVASGLVCAVIDEKQRR
jgi:hypothetical protein